MYFPVSGHLVEWSVRLVRRLSIREWELRVNPVVFVYRANVAAMSDLRISLPRSMGWDHETRKSIFEFSITVAQEADMDAFAKRSTGPRMFCTLMLAGALALGLSSCGDSGTTSGNPLSESSSPEKPSNLTPPEDSNMASATPNPGNPSSDSASESNSPTAEVTQKSINAVLTILIRQNAESAPQHYTLECVDGVPGPASTLPNAESACTVLADVGKKVFFTPPDPDRLCTQQYGGPQTATITGTLDDNDVNSAFSLKDGCEISRWNALEPLLGKGGAV